MKKKLLISALVAGVLTMTGCGSSSNSDTPVDTSIDTSNNPSIALASLANNQVVYQKVDNATGLGDGVHQGQIVFCEGDRFAYTDWNGNGVGDYSVSGNVLTLTDANSVVSDVNLSAPEFRVDVWYKVLSATSFNYDGVPVAINTVTTPDCTGAAVPANPVPSISLIDTSSVENHKINFTFGTEFGDYTFCAGNKFKANYNDNEYHYGTWAINSNGQLEWTYENNGPQTQYTTNTTAEVNFALTAHYNTETLDLDVVGILDYTNATVKPTCAP